jgi:sulfane dehydrogenase subunit SoxC
VDGVSFEELQLAARNHALPLEAMRAAVTPVGLHYLLIHFDIPFVDAATWRLSIGGLVEEPLELSLDDLRARPATTLAVTLECAGNGRALLSPRAPASQPWVLEAVGNAEWTGTRLAPLLHEAGLQSDAAEVVFTGLDRGVQGGVEHLYERSLSLDDALRDEVLLAYEVNGEPLPPQHGYPLRLLVPGWYGMTHVKWLRSITVGAGGFEGWQQAEAYHFHLTEEDAGTPVTRMLPRSLMIPPGIPEFLERTRLLDAGPCTLEGRAWSGQGMIERVEVSTDGGETWGDAKVGEVMTPWAWVGWQFDWDATAGEHVLSCRATDSAGNVQPGEAEWNVGGYCNNAVQRVRVTVS